MCMILYELAKLILTSLSVTRATHESTLRNKKITLEKKNLKI